MSGITSEPQTALSELEQRISELEAGIASLETLIKELETDIANLEALVKGLILELTLVEDRVERKPTTVYKPGALPVIVNIGLEISGAGELELNFYSGGVGLAPFRRVAVEGNEHDSLSFPVKAGGEWEYLEGKTGTAKVVVLSTYTTIKV
jgi:uncharacterized coiled-coil protein SlyX